MQVLMKGTNSLYLLVLSAHFSQFWNAYGFLLEVAHDLHVSQFLIFSEMLV